MNLTNQATQDLRIALRKSYGEDFDRSLSEDQIIEIGELLLNVLSESLKMKVVNPEVSIPNI